MGFTVITEASSTEISEGKYNAEFTRIEAVEGKFGASWRWFWKLYHADHGEIVLTMMSSPKLTPATKAGAVLSAMNHGKFPGIGQEVDLEQYIGCQCEILVTNKTTDEGITYSNVSAVVKLIDDTNAFIAQKREGQEPTDDDGDEDDVPF